MERLIAFLLMTLFIGSCATLGQHKVEHVHGRYTIPVYHFSHLAFWTDHWFELGETLHVTCIKMPNGQLMQSFPLRCGTCRWEVDMKFLQYDNYKAN